MAELGRDQPDYCSTTTLSRFWDTAHADAQVSSGSGYNSQNAWTGASINATLTRYHTKAGQATFSIGHRLRVASYPASEKELIVVLAGDGTVQCCVTLGTTGLLKLYRGASSGTLLATGTVAIPTATALDFGLTGTIDPVSGSLSAYVGTSGTPESFAANVQVLGSNTRGHASDSTWRGYKLGLTSNVFQSHLYWRDADAGDGGVIGLSPGYLVTCLRPDAAGILTGWVANTGTLATALDDTDADDETTIGNSSAPGAEFSVSLASFASTSTIYGLSTIATVKNGVGFGNYHPLIVLNAASAPSIMVGDPFTVSTSAWRSVFCEYPRHPVTLAPLTHTDINNAEIGGKTALTA